MCILRVLPEKTSERIGQERAGTEWTVVKSKIRLCIRNRSYGQFLHGGILMGIALPIPSHRAKSCDFARCEGIGSAIPIKMPPWRNRPQERFRIRRRILLLTSVHSVPARSCPIFSGVFSGKTRRMHIQYQRYPAGVAHEIFKVRCDFVRNQEFSEVKPKVNRSV